MSNPPRPPMFTFTVERYLHGVRVDTFLLRHLRNYTPFRMQRMISAGLVDVDAQTVPLDTRVWSGQWVSIRPAEPPDKLLAAEPAPLDVLYEDAWLCVVDKPPGVVAHPVGEFQTGTLANALQAHLDKQTPMRGLLRPGIVHRLDRMTSGVIVTVKDHASHRGMTAQFERGRVRKTYLAIVEGEMPAERGEINLPIGVAADRQTVLVSCAPGSRRPRPACTRYEVLRRAGGLTLVRAYPLTGRVHQVRIHLASIGCPVVGDEFYGAWGVIKPDRADDDGEPRHALHAESIHFRHPITGTALTCTAPMPTDMRALIGATAAPGERGA